jgi:hypothetical protein
MTIAEWVRQALIQARRQEASGDVGKKLAAVRAAVKHNAGPVVEIDEMLADIERGYLADPSFDTD